MGKATGTEIVSAAASDVANSTGCGTLAEVVWKAVISGACAFTDAAVDNTATMTNRNDEQRVLSAEKGVVIEVPIVLICVSRSRHFSCS